MEPLDMAWRMGVSALISAPLAVVWLGAVAAGASLARTHVLPGACLASAGLLELVRLVANVVLGPVPIALLDAGLLPPEWIETVFLGRQVVFSLAQLVSWVLLAVGVLGGRTRPSDPPAPG